MSYGIDYGMGTANIDKQTGIRYGVIHANEVCQAWSESSESDYGDPSCPKCGNGVIEYNESHEEWDSTGSDYACESCERAFDSSQVYGDEALAFTLDDGEYKASQSGDDCDIFILKSPYYTHAQFCSPCAPGACYLMSEADTDGPRAYCFGHDWFEDNRAPYTVYRVSDGSLVYTPSANEEKLQ